MVGKLGPEDDVGDPVISPDGALVAYDKADGLNRDIWTVEIASGKTTRITFAPEIDHEPVWSRDGARVAFESHRTPPGLYVAAAAGGSAESLLLAGGDLASDWTSDGSFLLFNSMRSTPLESILILPLTGERKPRVWLQAPSDLRRPALSPDGKWVAYAAAESGRSNVFVQPFDPNSPPGTGKWQISTAGGSQPVWRADGRELFYLSPENVLMAAAVRPGPTFQYDRPVPLFDTRLHQLRGPRNDYTTYDGKRFLFRVPAQGGPAPPIHVIVNWQAALRNGS